MSMISEDRPSDSPYVDAVMRGWTLSAGSSIRPAEINWHMVLTKHDGITEMLIVGPLQTSGMVTYGEGGEILWIKFKLGMFMPHLPMRSFLDQQTALPDASRKTFWLKGSSWQFPDYENADTFVERLVREGILVCDPVVSAVLQGHPHDVSPRTVRHRFLQATGLTQTHIFQVERARRAEAFLQQGASILDTVELAAYYDQPHLTRSLKRWIGYTPAQIIAMSDPVCHSVQDDLLLPDYATEVIAEAQLSNV